MDRKDLLFYDAYEAFYAMARTSAAFSAFCRDAFGEDLSQDGFSSLAQVDMILPYIPDGEDVHILDVGCGSGKLLGYLRRRTGAHIHGFDYSSQAIETAREMFPGADLREGIIGETDYPAGTFDVVISMDSVYFAKDMTAFVSQVKKWLRPRGVFFVGYQEGDVMPRTKDIGTAVLTEALERSGMSFEVTDITAQTYDLLRRKRQAAIKHREAFEAEGRAEWYDLLMLQTDCAESTLEQFRRDMARYIYVARKD